MLQDRLSTGIPGLDEVLYSGFLPGQAYLVQGGPGTGKTTLGLHFLATGVANGEKTLFITLGESAEQICKNADVLDFDTKHIVFLDLSPTSEFFAKVQTYDIFSPDEVEREPTNQK
jgi:circadian clock protein KaiC